MTAIMVHVLIDLGQSNAPYTPYSNSNVRVCVDALSNLYPPLFADNYTHTNPFNPTISLSGRGPVKAWTIQ